MPYGVGTFASVVLFGAMFVALSPHFMALQQASRQLSTVLVFRSSPGFDLNQPVSSEVFSNRRAPFAEQSPSLNPGGALAALTSSYAQPNTNPTGRHDRGGRRLQQGSAYLRLVQHRAISDACRFEVALRQSAASSTSLSAVPTQCRRLPVQKWMFARSFDKRSVPPPKRWVSIAFINRTSNLYFQWRTQRHDPRATAWWY